MKNNDPLSQSIARRGPTKPRFNWVPAILIGSSLTYLSLILYLPAANVFYQAFHKGISPFLDNLSRPEFFSAVKVSLSLTLVAVPINTIFGLCAAMSIARNQFRGRNLLLSIIDLPFAISPVVTGLMMMLLYGGQGWFGGWLNANDINIVFAFPGMALATAFVSMPFVVREVIPVLEEAGTNEEEAARTLGANDWQVFWRVTLPNIRWGLMYGVLLTNARAMGEFGAVSVVSGNISNATQSLPLYVEDAYKQYETEVAFSAAVLLAFLAVITLFLKEIIERKTSAKQEK
jgi:sulfate/thiosulfate transport system permease protein